MRLARARLQDGVEDRIRILPLERQLPGQHLVQHHARGPDIGPAVDAFAEHLLGRHITERAEKRACFCELPAVARGAGQAEVHNFQLAGPQNDQV